MLGSLLGDPPVACPFALAIVSTVCEARFELAEPVPSFSLSDSPDESSSDELLGRLPDSIQGSLGPVTFISAEMSELARANETPKLSLLGGSFACFEGGPRRRPDELDDPDVDEPEPEPGAPSPLAPARRASALRRRSARIMRRRSRIFFFSSWRSITTRRGFFTTRSSSAPTATEVLMPVVFYFLSFIWL
jgi:hypothetical protein